MTKSRTNHFYQCALHCKHVKFPTLLTQCCTVYRYLASKRNESLTLLYNTPSAHCSWG